MKKILLLISIFTYINIYAAEYVIPTSFDNLLQEVKSSNTVMITNASSLSASSRTITIGNQTLKGRCAIVPKISCKSPLSSFINVAMSSISLREDVHNELVIPYDTSVYTQEFVTTWEVCAVALGGVTWDKSELVSSVGNDGVTTITHDFKANLYRKLFYFFSNASASLRGHNNSYMLINTHQVCR
ncbi:MAG: Unknown protein [uncultured Sulfurovum sp.]|uniref:Uncharacterized protein n=1 Tax=uncultured Sulfurovum sp. TaxID=269237 RepID=A0A6S6SDY3_9BACT|nr:MAG: Unknown protein [uncultured Sulfurovum sp.]